jgi:hypothetical protein
MEVEMSLRINCHFQSLLGFFVGLGKGETWLVHGNFQVLEKM